MTALGKTARVLADAVRASMAMERTPDAKLAAVARPFTEHFCDACLVDRRASDGGVVRLAILHADQSRAPVLQAISWRFPPSDRHPALIVLRTGRASFEPVVSERTLRRIAADEAHYAMLRETGPRSSIRIPVRWGKQVIAVISLAITGHRRTIVPRLFSDEDYEVARAVGRQISKDLSSTCLLPVQE